MCTMVLKETLAYYTVYGGSAFCTLLDATKAFDRVNYCKLFSKLMTRNIPPAYLRLLLNMYTNSIARVSWNGNFSHSFNVENGVRQGGIVSPVLFCVYLDGLLQQLCNSGVGCYIGKVYVGALAYADDVALLAPTPSAICADCLRFARNTVQSSLSLSTHQSRLGCTSLSMDGHFLAMSNFV